MAYFRRLTGWQSPSEEDDREDVQSRSSNNPNDERSQSAFKKTKDRKPTGLPIPSGEDDREDVQSSSSKYQNNERSQSAFKKTKDRKSTGWIVPLGEDGREYKAMAYFRRLTGGQIPSGEDDREDVQSSSSKYPNNERNQVAVENYSQRLSNMLQSICRRFSSNTLSKDEQSSKEKIQGSGGVSFSPIPSIGSERTASQIKQRICSILNEARPQSSCSYRTAQSGDVCDSIRDRLRDILQLAGGSSSRPDQDPCASDPSMADDELDSIGLSEIRSRLAVILQQAEDSKCRGKKCDDNTFENKGGSECENNQNASRLCSCGLIRFFVSYLICRCKNCIPCIIRIALLVIAIIIAICTLAFVYNNLNVLVMGKKECNKCGPCFHKTPGTSLKNNEVPPDVFPTCMLYQWGAPCACTIINPPKCTWWRSVFINNCKLDKNSRIWI